MIDYLLISIALIALIVGSITDIKKREVPDWLSFSLIPMALMIRLFQSIIMGDWSFIISGLFGFSIFFVIAMVMFYTGQWGGGDSKLLMGLGAVLGFSASIYGYLFAFLINTMIIGAIYGLLASVVLVMMNLKGFMKAWKEYTKKHWNMFRLANWLMIGFITVAVFITDLQVKILFFSMVMIIYIGFYTVIFIKSVEKSCMIRLVSPEIVTEGDWIAKDIMFKGKRISGPKDLGISRKQLKTLMELYKQNKIKKVWIKNGIPFVPSFLIAYICTLIFGNLVSLILI